MTAFAQKWSMLARAFVQRLVSIHVPFLGALNGQPQSADYQDWRSQFLRDRLQFAAWIAFPFSLTSAAHAIYMVLFQAEQFNDDIFRHFGSSELAVPFRNATIVASALMNTFIGAYIFLQRIPWMQRHPALLFLCLSWFATLVDPLVGAYFGIPLVPSEIIFLLQAVLIPVHWRLHLLSQVVPIAFCLIVLPLSGLTHIGDRAFYNAHTVAEIIDLFWICLICGLAVGLYDRLKQSEFEARRQIQVFLHSISHDLQTPVIGTSVVLNNLLGRGEETVMVKRSVLERLLQGSNRQLTLINSLLEAHVTEVQGIVLRREPIALKPVLDSVLADLQHALTRNQVQVTNRVAADLPLVWADANQLWRVFSNLIGNALKHNPYGFHLILEAVVITSENEIPGRSRHPKPKKTSMLLCSIQDNGVGIPPHQHERLFELYARGSRARYMPGLGLGLYVCKQILTAHGGEIGVSSRVGEGSTFWFTLPY